MEVYSVGNYGSDCTCDFAVKFSKKYTVREFLNLVLERNEWGNICFSVGKIKYFSEIQCIYKGKEITYSNIPEEYMNRYVLDAKAHGGWSNMDYAVEIK